MANLAIGPNERFSVQFEPSLRILHELANALCSPNDREMALVWPWIPLQIIRYLHLESLSHILDEIGGLLTIAQFLFLGQTRLSTGRVLELLGRKIPTRGGMSRHLGAKTKQTPTNRSLNNT